MTVEFEIGFIGLHNEIVSGAKKLGEQHNMHIVWLETLLDGHEEGEREIGR